MLEFLSLIYLKQENEMGSIINSRLYLFFFVYHLLFALPALQGQQISKQQLFPL